MKQIFGHPDLITAIFSSLLNLVIALAAQLFYSWVWVDHQINLKEQAAFILK